MPGVVMFASEKRSERRGFEHLRQKLESLGVDETALAAFLNRVGISSAKNRSDDIVAPGESPTHSTIVLEGVACLYERLVDGSRQIFAFQYPGDFCHLNRHVLPDTNSGAAVAAVTRCTIGRISHSDLDQLLGQYPALATAMWRAAMLEAGMLRQNLLSVGRRPALKRVAHLLCEQLARQEAVGIYSSAIALSGLDLADAAGLSAVHISRTFAELQRRRLLVRDGRTMKVVDKTKLAALAGFNGSYLNMPLILSHWQVEIEASRPAMVRSATGASLSKRPLCTSPPDKLRTTSADPDRSGTATAAEGE